MKIRPLRNLRLYEGEAGGTPQAGNPDSQADKGETTKNPDAVQDTDTDNDPNEVAEKIARANREAAKRRTELREAEAKIAELEARLDETATSTQSDTERLKAQVAKLTAQVQTEKAAREESERLRMAQLAAMRYDIPEEFLPALQGKTQDDIDDAAKQLHKVFQAQAKKLAQVTPPDPDGGPKKAVPLTPNDDDLRRQQKAYKSAM